MSKPQGGRSSILPQRVKADGPLKSLATPQSVCRNRSMPLLAGSSAAPNRKVSFFGHGATRRSSQFGASAGSEKIKDTRPLHDKGFQQRTVKNLCEFLAEHDCPLALSPRELQAPSTKLFLHIFEFMYRLDDSDYSLPSSKVEEEVPRIFKERGYPFTLAKSAMYTVGAPHTWPHILGATLWLMEYIKMTKAVCESVMLFSPMLFESREEEIAYMEKKIKFEHTCNAYNKFMDGSDDFSQEDDKLVRDFMELYQIDEDAMKALKAENERLLAEIQYLLMEKEKAPDRLQAFKLEKTRLLSATSQTQGYIAQMDAHCQQLDQKLARKDEEIEEAASELASVKKETERLEEIYERQELTPTDVQRLRCEEKELQATLHALTKDAEQLDKQCWDKEMSIHRMREQVEQKQYAFREAARKLKLMPATAENAGGRNIDFTVHEHPEQIKQHFSNVVKPLITAFIGKVKNQVQLLNSQLVTKITTSEQLTTLISDSERDVKKLEFDLRVLEESLAVETEAFEREERRHRQEMEELAKKHSEKQKHVDDGLQEAIDSYKKAEADGKEHLKQLETQRRQSCTLLNAVTLLIYKHFTFVENMMEELRRQTEVDYEAQMSAQPIADLLVFTPKERETMALLGIELDGEEVKQGQQEGAVNIEPQE